MIDLPEGCGMLFSASGRRVHFPNRPPSHVWLKDCGDILHPQQQEFMAGLVCPQRWREMNTRLDTHSVENLGARGQESGNVLFTAASGEMPALCHSRVCHCPRFQSGDLDPCSYVRVCLYLFRTPQVITGSYLLPKDKGPKKAGRGDEEEEEEEEEEDEENRNDGDNAKYDFVKDYKFNIVHYVSCCLVQDGAASDRAAALRELLRRSFAAFSTCGVGLCAGFESRAAAVGC